MDGEPETALFRYRGHGNPGATVVETRDVVRSVLTVSASLVLALAVWLAHHVYTGAGSSDGPRSEAGIDGTPQVIEEPASPATNEDGEPAERPPEEPAQEPAGAAPRLDGRGTEPDGAPPSAGCSTPGERATDDSITAWVASINAQRAADFDLSPDCSLIAFTTGSQIYTARPDGSDLRQLTDPTLYGRDPSVSPDGTRIAFTSGSEIWVMGIDGTDVEQLTDSNASEDNASGYRFRSVDPDWSPDGTRIAFTSNRDGNDEIYTMNADGTGVRRLTNNTTGIRQSEPDWSPEGGRTAVMDWDPDWSPDGTRIAFTSNRDGNDEIYTMNADGTGVRRLTHNDVDLDWDPDWSPDGARIAFTSNRDGSHQIYTMNADGTGVRLLARGGDGAWEPAWWPDGSHVIFQTLQHRARRYAAADSGSPAAARGTDSDSAPSLTCSSLTDMLLRDSGRGAPVASVDAQRLYEHGWSPDCSRMVFVGDEAAGYAIVTAAPDGSDVRQLTNDDHWYSNPVWSPDGTRIAFETNRDGSYEIFTMNADGTDAVQLTNLPHHQRNPAWSADGSRISFQRGAAHADIWTIGSDGSDLRRTTDNSSYDGNAVWSPEDARIAFISNRDGDNDIYTINADGTDIRKLTANDTDDRNPIWSPDGARIAFISNRDGDNDIYTINADGTDIRKLTANDTDDRNPVWSPDGARIAFISNRDGVREFHVTDAAQTTTQ